MIAAVRALAGWKGYAAAAAIAGVLAGGVAWKVQGWRWDADVTGIERDQATKLADATQLARKTEQARWAKREGVIHDAKEQAAAAAADADRARAAADRLRSQLAFLQRRAGDSAAAGGSQGQSGADTLDLLIGLLSGMGAAGGDIGRYADDLRIAGLACERIHDSLP
ncbi:MAG: DUF2514 family protein [Burkholderiaceae bacterium]